MLLWFVATAVVSVHYVFNDPAFDYRLLVLGSLLPDLVDVPFGRAAWGHSVTAAVAALVVVMVATAGRRPSRRLLLGLPIGMLLHLVWDGAFTLNASFWWPFTGDWGDVAVPSVGRGWWNVPLEIGGLLLLVRLWRRFGLAEPSRRQTLLRSGTLHRVG